MAGTRLEKTFTASNRKTFTISTWIKRSGLTTNNYSIYGAGTNDSTDRDYLAFLADSGAEDKLYFNAKVSSSVVAEFYTNRRFRDPSAWYHIVLAFDTTQATDTNRMKLYVNGELQTFSSVTYPNQNRDMNTNNTVHKIGSTIGNSYYFDGSMSHFHFIDGTAYAASTFGSTDSTTGEWKINTSPSVTYGTNGFFILKDGNTITDSSPNSNNFSLGGGTLTKTEDCPSNVFATLNPLSPPASGLDIRNGNTHVFNDDESNVWQTVPATLAISPTAKIYWEIKCVGVWGSASCQMHGITDLDNTIQALTGQASDNATSFAWRNDASFRTNGSTISGTTWATSYTTNDFLMFALDNANGALYAGKNGTWLNSGNPTSGASKTGALSVTAGLNYAPHSELKYGSDKPAYNFGNGYYVTTAVSSAGTTASTPGIFEYDVPTGYQPLSTKGLNA